MNNLFVAYSGTDNKGMTYFGNTIIRVSFPLRTIDDIHDIEYSIEQSRGFEKGSCKIINWQRVETK